MGFYFSRFEDRKPPEPLKTPRVVKILWQIMSVAALVLGANYIRWRWTESLNMDALWYALPLVIAETCAWIGTVLFTINLWREDDPPQQPAPLDINDCLNPDDRAESRPVRVDLFIATYSEDVELVRLSIKDALKIRYPRPARLSHPRARRWPPPGDARGVRGRRRELHHPRDQHRV
ncbi:Cellulose synthase (UDP-forming) [Cronobacter dublinensis 1210]|uniref:Cellulose synthase (UDP-forming) n=1 Tax=Cronobacter dublinensis 1210 TaxID=1208656 RepID=A0ABP1WAC5_9ENTR|nr:Cellulose synthase (UDP-forming) [Cronobacter dublinensis 1210]